jgi:hypothetical protein
MRLGKLLEGALLILHMPIVPHTLPLTSMLHLLSLITIALYIKQHIQTISGCREWH